MNSTSLFSLDTEYSADSIESLCDPKTGRSIVVCATYQISQESEETGEPIQADSGEKDGSDDSDEDESPPDPKVTKKGRLLVYELISNTNTEGDEGGDDGGERDRRVELKEIQREEGAAILDTKWSTNYAPNPTLAVAENEGITRLWTWKNNLLTDPVAIRCDEDASILCLSLDWSDRIRPSSDPASRLAVSLSNGHLCILGDSQGSSSPLRKIRDIEAHDYECWIVAYDPFGEGRVLYSGGDDCALKGWDMRSPSSVNQIDGSEYSEYSEYTCTFTNKKTFAGGVTSIAAHPSMRHILAVGSYDSQVCIFDTRNMARPVEVGRHNAINGGGVWRIKWDGQHGQHGGRDGGQLDGWDGCDGGRDGGRDGGCDGGKKRMGIAAMHGGFEVVEWESACWTARQTRRFEEHKSMGYGLDWAHRDDLLVSCSFYDHSLHVWSS